MLEVVACVIYRISDRTITAAISFNISICQKFALAIKTKPCSPFSEKETELFRRVLWWKPDTPLSFRSRKSRGGKAAGRPISFFEKPQRDYPPREPYSTLKLYDKLF